MEVHRDAAGCPQAEPRLWVPLGVAVGSEGTQEASGEPSVLFPQVGDGHLCIYFMIIL